LGPRDALDMAITSHMNLMVRNAYDAIVQGVTLFDVKIVRDLQAKTVAHVYQRVRNWKNGLASTRK
jgi:hypothetical protein